MAAAPGGADDFMPADMPAAGDADTEETGAGSACRSGCRPPAPRTQSTPMAMPPSVRRIKISCHQLPLPPIANLMRPRAAMTAPHMPMCASTLELPYLAVPPSVGRPGEQERGTGWGSPGFSFPVSFPGVALPVQTRPAPARECGARARSSIIIRRPVAGRVSTTLPDAAAGGLLLPPDPGRAHRMQTWAVRA
jgi:hypothetical protein